MKRHLLLCATNYIGQSSALKGCLNDMKNVRAWLQKFYGSWDSEVALLGSDMSKANWLEALREFVARLGSDGQGFHAHSHHGSYDRDPKESDGRRELWVPDDYGKADMISDDDVSAIYNGVQTGARLTDWADCCHAAGSTRDLSFKDEGSRFLPITNEVLTNLTSTPVDVERRPGIAQLAACRSSQTSADAYINGEYCGAFTCYALAAQADCPLTLGDIVDDSSRLLARNGYEQRPEFCGCDALALKTIWTR